MSILENYGVLSECDIDPSGRLLINLTTDRDVRITVNGVLLKADAGSPPAQKFWQPDGTQTDQPPLDLRGEQR